MTGQPTLEKAKTNNNGSRDLILQRSLELFTRQGYDGTSIDDIRQAAGFKSKASFYTHFKSKEELADALLTTILEEEAAVVAQAFQQDDEDNPEQRLWLVGRAFISWGLSHPQQYAFCFLRIQQEMLIQSRPSVEADQSNLALEYLLEQLRAAQYPIRGISSKALVSMIVGLISKAVIDQASFGPISHEKKVSYILEMCWGLLFSEVIRVEY